MRTAAPGSTPGRRSDGRRCSPEGMLRRVTDLTDRDRLQPREARCLALAGCTRVEAPIGRPRLSLALNVTLFLPTPRFAVPNTASFAGAPDSVLILSSSTFAPDSPDGVAVPTSVNPLLFFLNELTVMAERRLRADRDLDGPRGRGHHLPAIGELHLDVPVARRERRQDREVALVRRQALGRDRLERATLAHGAGEHA